MSGAVLSRRGNFELSRLRQAVRHVTSISPDGDRPQCLCRVSRPDGSRRYRCSGKSQLAGGWRHRDRGLVSTAAAKAPLHRVKGIEQSRSAARSERPLLRWLRGGRRAPPSSHAVEHRLPVRRRVALVAQRSHQPDEAASRLFGVTVTLEAPPRQDLTPPARDGEHAPPVGRRDRVQPIDSSEPPPEATGLIRTNHPQSSHLDAIRCHATNVATQRQMTPPALQTRVVGDPHPAMATDLSGDQGGLRIPHDRDPSRRQHPTRRGSVTADERSSWHGSRDRLRWILDDRMSPDRRHSRPRWHPGTVGRWQL